MTKKCAICGSAFETSSETRQTCQLECANEFVRRKKLQARYEHIANDCNFRVLNRQYHGSEHE